MTNGGLFVTEQVKYTLGLYNSLEKIAKKESGNNLHTLEDLFCVCENSYNTCDVKFSLHLSHRFRRLLGDFIENKTNIHKADVDEMIFQVLVLESRWSFDSYFQALEYNRPVEEQFYLPRRNTLMKHGVIQALEDLLIWDNIDELFLSMPPRVGKTTLGNFVVSWIVGFEPAKANLYCSNSGTNTKAFYVGLYSILTDDYTYNWKKIFPHTKFDKLSMCDAKETCLDTGIIKRYHSFTARSIDATLNGACDCNRLLIADDLVDGHQEAMNFTRLHDLWCKVDTDLLSRAKESAKIWWIGTRWSINDPIGVRLNTIDETIRIRNIVIPALDENEESNFDYLYGVGFSTTYYKRRKNSFEMNNDMSSWLAVYQGEPIEKEGLLFYEDQWRTYNGVLPDVPPTRKFAYCDVAWGGGDFVAMPIIYQYDTDFFCVGWIYDSHDKKVTQPRVANAIKTHGLGSVKFEKNNGGDGYRENVGKLLNEMKVKCNLTSDYANNTMAKNTRIFEEAPSIREIIFLDKELRDKEYEMAMNNVCAFSMSGKKQHDDAPDSLAGAMKMANEVIEQVTIKIFQRPF